ncbi:ataxin-10-like isoform X2 [Montipora foliosa]|uniref:ataxin-10-like isoform X2 n=1 Tax=Montipora foliosa TaxID=591990 RepID=UPI0035F1FDED
MTSMMAGKESPLTKLGNLSRKLGHSSSHSQPSWIEVEDGLEELKIWALEKQNRNALLENNFLQAKDVIMACKDRLCVNTVTEDEKDKQDLILCLKTLTGTFRFLRNCCVEVPKNQSWAISSGAAKQGMEVILILLRPVFLENKNGTEIAAAVQSGLQLLGNAVVKNDATQELMWNCCFPQFFLDVLSSTDQSIQDCLCMIIFNCLNQQRRLELTKHRSGLKIISHIIHLCANKSPLEWGYFILDTLICEGLFPDMYHGIESDPLARVILLDLFHLKITDALDESSEKSKGPEMAPEFYASSVNYLSHQFEKHVFQVLIVTRLLSLLSTSTGLHSSITALQERKSLLETCVGLLKETSTPEAKVTFSNVGSIPQDVTSERLAPSQGFQRDLVRVIGNMCYRHRPNQDTVRELDGISLLLDHCNVDDQNPYICQWAIFAIRNILENNKANQDIVASIDRLGLADTSRLRQFGVDAVELDGGRIKLMPIKGTLY